VLEKPRIDVSIPNYHIEGEIGRGGIATVYLAVQKSLNREVALKVMSPALAADPNFTERFMREGRTVAQLSHPNIVTIHDIGVSDYHHYIAMEYVQGGSLTKYLVNQPSPRWGLAVIQQIASALGYAHRQGFIHRDVKPENILFREDGTAVLTDFGIAKSTHDDDSQLTTVGTIVGTPRYMSPEQADGRGTDPRSDIYALGVILYEMLAGHPPYQGPDSLSTLYAHVNEPIPSLPEEVETLQPLIDSMLAKQLEDRVPDCRTLVNIIRMIQRDGKVPTLQNAKSSPDWASSVSPSADYSPKSPGRRRPTLGSTSRRRTTSVDPYQDLSSPTLLLRWGLAAALPVAILIALVYFITADSPSPEIQPEVTAELPTATPTASRLPVPDAEQNPVLEVSPPPMVTSLYQPPPDEKDQASMPQSGETIVQAQAPIYTQEQIGDLLALAERQVEQEQLAEPPGDNALETYKAVIDAEPDNQQAKQALADLAEHYLELAQQQSIAKDHGSALLYAERGLEAVPEFEELLVLKEAVAQSLDAETLFDRAENYYYGRGVGVNYATAFEWYQRAAQYGHAKAQFGLAVSYANGQGIARNENSALRWFRRAAAQGDQEAMHYLGLGLLFGEYPDPDEAANWFQKLADNEYQPSYRVLSWLYTSGTGVSQSIKQSIRWSVKAAMKRSPNNPYRKSVVDWDSRLEEVYSGAESNPDPDQR